MFGHLLLGPRAKTSTDAAGPTTGASTRFYQHRLEADTAETQANRPSRAKARPRGPSRALRSGQRTEHESFSF